MNALDTFSGIGGFALGFERVGINTIAFCERERYCRAVLAKRWPGRPCFPDVKRITADDLAPLGPIDIVSGGVPCQPASLAGSRRGRSDDRWLWPAFFDVVRLSRARWVLAENPLGLISLKPDGLAWVCGTFRELGYEPWPITVSANNVGAPHLRKRVWIVAHSEREQLRHESRRRGGARGPSAAELGDDDPQGALADADRRGLEVERLAQHPGELGAPGREPHGCGAPGRRNGADPRGAEALGAREALADSDCDVGSESTGQGPGSELEASAGSPGESARRSARTRQSARWWWLTEPDVGRVAHGIPHRVDRLRALGNACIPQIVEAFGIAILEAERAMTCVG